jgi:hypothetical protein
LQKWLSLLETRLLMNKKTLLAYLGGAGLALPALSFGQIFSDDFSSASSAANWTVNTGGITQANWGWDYSTMGIPLAPNSAPGASTMGVMFKVNHTGTAGTTTGGQISAINMSPTGLSLSGTYTVRFDMWMNFNGPMPSGYGSTEFGTFGVGTAGTTVQWGTGSDGRWFAVDGEGGSGTDFRAYVNTTLQGPTSGVYAAGTNADNTTDPTNNVRRWSNPYYHTAIPGENAPPALQQTAYPDHQTAGTSEVSRKGTVGFTWSEVEIRVADGTADWYLNGLRIATLSGVADNTNAFIGYWDPFASVAGHPDLAFVVYDNFQVIPEPSTYAAIFGGLALIGAFVYRRRKNRA